MNLDRGSKGDLRGPRAERQVDYAESSSKVTSRCNGDSSLRRVLGVSVLTSAVR